MSVPYLVAIASDREMGKLHCGKNAQLTFEYADRWRATKGAYPLSLSMPLAAKKHPSGTVTPFLWGLLPDNDGVLEQWGKTYHVSPRNPFALLSHVGEDCAGAVQFIRPERVDDVLSKKDDAVTWLSDAEFEERIRDLRRNHAAGRRAGDNGQFSLAGAQPKTALLFQNDKWGIPSGSIPTSHIIKPPTGAYEGLAENEHFCLRLAAKLGIPAASSEVMHIGDEIAFVAKRYDRVEVNGNMRRLHQEDFCQTLSVMPHSKYQNEGGPGTGEIINVLSERSSKPEDDILTFIRANIFNWIIAGTDAHAKNFSLLIGAEGSARLAPLYDIVSSLPYKDIPIQKAKLAMKIGGEYRVQYIQPRHWARLADSAGVSASDMDALIAEMQAEIKNHTSVIADALKTEAVDHPVVDTLVKEITKRVKPLK